MDNHEKIAWDELGRWQRQMSRTPSLWDRATRGLQTKLGNLIPEKVHAAITAVIKQMTRAVLSGSQYTAPSPLQEGTLAVREKRVRERIDFYRKAAAASGGITGAGGFLLGLADFPLLITLKLKLLFDIAARYGHSGDDYKERIYLLNVFQLAFSSQAHRRAVYQKMLNWRDGQQALPNTLHDFDWRSFQQEYRDAIDLPKLMQLIPVVGVPMGALVNYRLIEKLGRTAINAYRMRWFEERASRSAPPQRRRVAPT